MSTAYLSTANQQDAKGEVRDVCVQVAISQIPTGRPRFEPLLRHLGQVSIRRRALECIEEARDDTAKHQARAESGVGVVQASDDRDQGDAETGAGESDKGQTSTTDLVDEEGVEDDSGQTDTAEDDRHLERIFVTGQFEEVRGVAAKDCQSDELLQPNGGSG